MESVVRRIKDMFPEMYELSPLTWCSSRERCSLLKKDLFDQAVKIFNESGGKISNVELGKKLGISATTIANWKKMSQWSEAAGVSVNPEPSKVAPPSQIAPASEVAPTPQAAVNLEPIISLQDLVAHAECSSSQAYTRRLQMHVIGFLVFPRVSLFFMISTSFSNISAPPPP
jgi:hypothetical protein